MRSLRYVRGVIEGVAYPFCVRPAASAWCLWGAGVVICHVLGRGSRGVARGVGLLLEYARRMLDGFCLIQARLTSSEGNTGVEKDGSRETKKEKGPGWGEYNADGAIPLPKSHEIRRLGSRR